MPKRRTRQLPRSRDSKPPRLCVLCDGIAESQSPRELTVGRVPTHSQRAQPALSLAGDSRGVNVFLWEHETLRPCQCVRRQSPARGLPVAKDPTRGTPGVTAPASGTRGVRHWWDARERGAEARRLPTALREAASSAPILGASQRQGGRSHEPGGGCQQQQEAGDVDVAGGGPRGAVPHLPRPDGRRRARSPLQAHLLQGMHPALDRQRVQLPPVPPVHRHPAAPRLAPLGSRPDPPAPGKAAAHQGAAGEQICASVPQRPTRPRAAQPLQAPPPAGAQLLLARGAQPAQPLRGTAAGRRGRGMAEAGGTGAAGGRRRPRAAARRAPLVSGRPDLSRERQRGRTDGKRGAQAGERLRRCAARVPQLSRSIASLHCAALEKTGGSSRSLLRSPPVGLGQPAAPRCGLPVPRSRPLHRAQRAAAERWKNRTSGASGRTLEHLRYEERAAMALLPLKTEKRTREGGGTAC